MISGSWRLPVLPSSSIHINYLYNTYGGLFYSWTTQSKMTIKPVKYEQKQLIKPCKKIKCFLGECCGFVFLEFWFFSFFHFLFLKNKNKKDKQTKNRYAGDFLKFNFNEKSPSVSFLVFFLSCLFLSKTTKNNNKNIKQIENQQIKNHTTST